MNKNKVIKWIGIAILTALIILIIFAAGFYFTELKPRIDVASSIGRAFENLSDGDVLALDLDDGQQILIDISEDRSLSGVVYGDGKVYDGLEFGFLDVGIWLNISTVSDKYYLLPWGDDTKDMLDEGALAEILNLSDAQKEEVSSALILMREELLEEDEFDFTPTFLNRILGLECLKADILELYENIRFNDEAKTGITLDGDEVISHKYTAEISGKYVKSLLNTDGAGAFLESLGDVLGDVYIEVYISDSELKYMYIDTEFLYMPGLDLSSLLSGEGSAEHLSFSPAPLSGEIYFGDDGTMNVCAELTGDYTSLEASFDISVIGTDVTWGFEEEEEFNIFEAGYLRLLIEAAKWEETLQEIL